MQMVTSTDAGYDEARAVFNAMVDKRPAVIAQCATPDDVADALALAARESYDVAVRAGGHSVAGMSMNDGGIVIDVRPMNEVTIDAVRPPWSRVGAGVTLGRVRPRRASARARRHGRTGVDDRRGGLHARRRVGMDRAQVRAGLRQPRLGRPRHCRRRGGHGERHRAPGPVLGAARRWRELRRGDRRSSSSSIPSGRQCSPGSCIWPGDAAPDVARRYRDVAFDAPDELGTGLVMLTAPPEEFVPEHLVGTTCVAVAVRWSGELADGDDVVRRSAHWRPRSTSSDRCNTPTSSA